MCCQKSPSPRVRQQRCASAQHLVADAVGVVPLLGVPRERELRVVERARPTTPRSAAPLRNAPRPCAGPPTRVQRGRRHDADHELARVLEPDERRPDRDAPHVALGAVDRVDDPAELGIGRRARPARRRTPRRAPRGRCASREPLADRALDRLIGLAHRREVGLGRRPRGRRRGTAPTVIASADVGELQRELQVRGDVHGAEHTEAAITRPMNGYGPQRAVRP